MPHTFIDARGRTWSITVDAPALAAISRVSKINLTKGSDGKRMLAIGRFAPKLAKKPVLARRIFWLLCQPQATALSISEADFGNALQTEGPYSKALAALFTAIASSFPPAAAAELRRLVREHFT